MIDPDSSYWVFLFSAYLISWATGYSLGLKILMVRKAVDSV